MAQQPTLMNVPFANGGAKNSIPQNTTTLGKASLVNGFPTETSMPLADGGIPPQRADFNGMLYWLSSFAVYQQSGGKFTYNATLEYDPPAIIFYNNDLWWCKQKNGPSTVVKTPGNDSNYWIKLRDYLANPLAAYPVGSYYISAISTSPATLFGGTWVQIQDRMILAAGSTYSAGTLVSPATGGSETKSLITANIPSHTHTFTTSETGLHTHTASGTTQTAGAHTHTVSGDASQVNNHTHGVSGSTAQTGDHAHTVSGNTAASGQHNHTVSGNTANVDAHTHTISGDTANSTSHTHSVGGSSSTTGSAGAHTHGVSGTTATSGEHSHTRGTMNITGTFPLPSEATATANEHFAGAFDKGETTTGRWSSDSNKMRSVLIDFNASDSWSGNTSTISAHTHTFSVTSASNGSHSHNINLTSGAGGVHNHSISLTSGASNKHLHAISLTTANSTTHTHSISFNSGTTGNHSHTISITSGGAGQHTHTISGTAASNGSHVHTVSITLNDSGKHKHTGTTNATGSGTAFNIMPPYIVAYVWRRTA